MGTGARPLPPFFVAVGTRDPLIRCTKRLKAALDALGTPCEMVIAPGEIHGYDAMIWRPAARAKWRKAHAFLENHLAGPDREQSPDPNGQEQQRAGAAQ